MLTSLLLPVLPTSRMCGLLEGILTVSRYVPGLTEMVTAEELFAGTA